MMVWLLVLEEQGLALGQVRAFATEAGMLVAAAREIKERLDAGEWPATSSGEAEIRATLASEELADAVSLGNAHGGQQITRLDVQVEGKT